LRSDEHQADEPMGTLMSTLTDELMTATKVRE